MDFKLIRNTICICSLSILAILGVVLYVNIKSAEETSVTDDTEVMQTGPENDGNGTELAGNGDDSGNSEETVYASGENIALNGDTRAFLYDETFWDPEEEQSVLRDSNDAVRLSLIATSVQKDLRLQIVDSNGELVTGETFFVTVEDVGQFKDLDQDGIIYIGDLRAGDYTVSIDETEGYHVAASQMNVHVRDKVEYRTINDISLLILSEDEIDPEQDAVLGHDMNEDADDSERTTAFTDLDMAVMGIDVSSFNGEIDWKRVKADGIDFAIIRCGYRGYTSGSLVEDKYFLKNIIGANEAGVKVGIYFFTQAVNEVEAVEEASMVITLCRDYQVDLPVFIDTESTGANGRADLLDLETRTLVCRAFCETMENAGYHAGVYASKNWFLRMLQPEKLQKYVIWLAEYKKEATYEGDYQFWQYTSSGWVDGVTGRVDLDIGNLSLANLNESGADASGAQDGDDSDPDGDEDAGADGTAGGAETSDPDSEDPEGEYSAEYTKSSALSGT